MPIVGRGLVVVVVVVPERILKIDKNRDCLDADGFVLVVDVLVDTDRFDSCENDGDGDSLELPLGRRCGGEVVGVAIVLEVAAVVVVVVTAGVLILVVFGVAVDGVGTIIAVVCGVVVEHKELSVSDEVEGVLASFALVLLVLGVVLLGFVTEGEVVAESNSICGGTIKVTELGSDCEGIEPE